MKRVMLAALVAVAVLPAAGCRLMDHMCCAQGHFGCRRPGCGRLANREGGLLACHGCGVMGCRGGCGLLGRVGHGCGVGGCGVRGCLGGCGLGHGGLLGRLHGGGAAEAGFEAGGPPTGHVTYPYYTTRGPRDFLAEDPRGIGP